MSDLDRDTIKARAEAFDYEELAKAISEQKFSVYGEWLVYDTDECNCGGGGSEMGYSHMPGCNYEPVGKLADLLAPDPDALALLAALEEAERERDEALAVIDKTLDNIDPESEYENPGVPQWTHAEVREMLQSLRDSLHPDQGAEHE